MKKLSLIALALAMVAPAMSAGDNIYLVKKSGVVEQRSRTEGDKITFNEPTGGLFSFTLNSTEGDTYSSIKGNFAVKIADETVKSFSPSKMEVGVVYSPFGNPTYERDGKRRLATTVGHDASTYDFTVYGLESGVTYTWRPYVKVLDHVYYGDSLRVAPMGDARTISRKVELKWYEYNDSPDWSGDQSYCIYTITLDRYNLGSSSEGDPGDYYAWGETSPKDEYTWDNYKWSNGTEATKYRATGSSVLYLESADDAATVISGGESHTLGYRDNSSASETFQFDYYYTKTWSSRVAPDGSTIYGLQITDWGGKETVFIPAGGYYDGTTLTDYGNEVALWQRVTFGFGKEADFVYGMTIKGTSATPYETDGSVTKHYRYMGLPIRACYGATRTDYDN